MVKQTAAFHTTYEIVAEKSAEKPQPVA